MARGSCGAFGLRVRVRVTRAGGDLSFVVARSVMKWYEFLIADAGGSAGRLGVGARSKFVRFGPFGHMGMGFEEIRLEGGGGWGGHTSKEGEGEGEGEGEEKEKKEHVTHTQNVITKELEKSWSMFIFPDFFSLVVSNNVIRQCSTHSLQQRTPQGPREGSERVVMDLLIEYQPRQSK